MKYLILLLLSISITRSTASDTVTIDVELPVLITMKTITNVIHGSNERGCPTCHMLRTALEGWEGGGVPAIYHPPHDADPYRPATRKWIITNLLKQITFSFIWNNLPYSNTTETLISSSTNFWNLSQDWKPSP